MNISSFKTESNMLSLYRFSLVTVTILSNGLTSQWVYASPAPLEQSKTMEISAKPENTPIPSSPQACTGIEADVTRLACYDTVFERHADEIPESALAGNPSQSNKKSEATKSSPISSAFADFFSTTLNTDSTNPSTSLLDKRWELSPESKLGTFTIRGNRPVYLLPFYYTNNPNKRPDSPDPANQVSTPLNIDKSELKLQLSLKTKAVENILDSSGDLWLSYTQTSHWQIFNSFSSRPFRETNYEPEVSLIFPTNYNLFGLNGRLFGFTLNHQSNGRSSPLSRSWNRATLNIGLERSNWIVMLRPWYRIPESRSTDDNPDISNYIGHGDIQITRKWDGHEFSLMLRPSSKGGAAQFDWSFPIHNNLRGFAQIFNGYGESLIDYNHRSTSVGLGISLLNWY
jgi:phospholipase A1